MVMIVGRAPHFNTFSLKNQCNFHFCFPPVAPKRLVIKIFAYDGSLWFIKKWATDLGATYSAFCHINQAFKEHLDSENQKKNIITKFHTFHKWEVYHNYQIFSKKQHQSAPVFQSHRLECAGGNIMAKQSEAIGLWKPGGRHNVVLLLMLNHTHWWPHFMRICLVWGGITRERKNLKHNFW